MDLMFTPGCGLMVYKPHLAEKVEAYLAGRGYNVRRNDICCHYPNGYSQGTRMAVVCSGCDRRFRKEHGNIEPVTLWEIMSEDAEIDLPDYGGIPMSIHDTCPTRNRPKVLFAVRALLGKMNIAVQEPEKTGAKGTCCGDSYYPDLSGEALFDKMRERAQQMPCGDVAVYCTGCMKSMKIGGREPRYLLDMIFGEETDAGDLDPDRCNAKVEAYALAHAPEEK